MKYAYVFQIFKQCSFISAASKGICPTSLAQCRDHCSTVFINIWQAVAVQCKGLGIWQKLCWKSFSTRVRKWSYFMCVSVCMHVRVRACGLACHVHIKHIQHTFTQHSCTYNTRIMALMQYLISQAASAAYKSQYQYHWQDAFESQDIWWQPWDLQLLLGPLWPWSC